MNARAIRVYEWMLNDPSATPDEKRCASGALALLYRESQAQGPEPVAPDGSAK